MLNIDPQIKAAFGFNFSLVNTDPPQPKVVQRNLLMGISLRHPAIAALTMLSKFQKQHKECRNRSNLLPQSDLAL